MIGAIAAGGRSARFGGEPKGLRHVGGARIIDRVARALLAVCSDIVLVANDTAAGDWLPGVRLENDAGPARGSIVAVQSALRAARGDDVLIVAWDMPFVTAALLAAVRDRLPGATAAVPVLQGRPEPFCAAYAPTAMAVVDAALAAREMRASRFIGALPRVVRLTELELRRFGDPARLFFNVNTPDDLVEAERLARED